MTTLLEADLSTLARAWAEVDPDPETRAETDALIGAGGTDLELRFGTRLTFGTAGLRGALGAGPSRMNRVLVRIVAAALAARLGEGSDRHVVIGFDARYKSHDFARDTARVLAAAGVRCTILPRPLPTPVLAFAVQHLDASAGVMVTASHNPRADNGYKVYWRGGAQLIPPVDQEISQLIERTHLLGDADLASLDHPDIVVAGDDLLQAYVDAIGHVVQSDGARNARVAYTPLHGVGREILLRAFAHAGFAEPSVVENQGDPDPDFPTTPFPNPEEAGVLDGLLALATEIDADVALANDPDADRLAVAVPNGDSWRLLTGDEVGWLLAEYLLSRPDPAEHGQRLVVNTVVSSRLLSEIAEHHNAHYAETLTGFKWIMAAQAEHADHNFVVGYEEALGYAVGTTVRDKDGISAALVIAEMVSELREEGRTLLDLLDDIHRRHGVHVTGQRSIRFEATAAETPLMSQAMSAIRDQPPATLGGLAVTALVDLSVPGGHLPPSDTVVLQMDGGRVVVRPSGTEPKMKVYGEVMVRPDDDLRVATVRARTQLKAMLDDAVAAATSPERPDLAGTATGADTGTNDDPMAQRADAPRAVLATGSARAAELRLIVQCLDLSTLQGDDTPGQVRALCAQARRPDPADPTVGPTAAVCVYPSLLALAGELTAGSTVRLASVAGAFPDGLSAIEVRLADIRDAVSAGALELNVVLNRSAFLSGRSDVVADELRAARQAAGSAYLKVIVEVAELGSTAAIGEATRLAIAAGADAIKSSTGKGRSGTTPAAVLIIAETIAEHLAQTGSAVGLEIAGGALSADDALGYMAIARSALGTDWLTPQRLRFDAPDLLTNVLTDLAATEGSLRG